MSPIHPAVRQPVPLEAQLTPQRIIRCANCGLSAERVAEDRERFARINHEGNLQEPHDIPCCDGTQTCPWCGNAHADDRPDGAACQVCVLSGLAEEDAMEEARR